MKVSLFKEGTWLRVKPCPPQIGQLLEPLLTYDRAEFNYTETGKRQGKVRTIPTSCYEYRPTQFSDGTPCRQLITQYGYRHLIQPLLKAHGCQLFYKDMAPSPHPHVYEPNWQTIRDTKLLWRQKEVLELLLSHEVGRIDCFAGFGKTFLIHLLARLVPRARIDVVTCSAALARGIYEELRGLLPSVGMRGGGKKSHGYRVMVYTAKSHKHAEYDADFVLVDEGHEMAVPTYLDTLANYRHARMFLLSASQDMRLDKADFELVGLFGPLLIKVGYPEGQAQKMVVPMRVYWQDVLLDVNPCEGKVGVPKLRHGVWRNDERNAKIVADARRYGPDEQVLITVSRIDHAVQLKYDLPEFELVHAAGGMDRDVREKFIRWGLLSEDEPLMTPARAAQLKADFESGKLKKAIVTTVWNRGVNFRHLAVLIRGDAGGSPIDDVQIPGRVSRLALPGGATKEVGVIHDYMDQFDKGLRRKALQRQKSYEAQGWEQVFPPTRSRYRQAMLEGESR